MYRAKISDKYPYPIWVYGKYITEPPDRPSDGAKRPKGHYIDKGGYPGANVYEINMNTLCRDMGRTDREGKAIFENDFLRLDFPDITGIISHTYGIVESNNMQGMDIVDFCTGEIINAQDIPGNILTVIGNLYDDKTFIDDMRGIFFESMEMPYIPRINVHTGDFPYWVIQCRKCGYKTLGAEFKTSCSKCEGKADCTLTSEIKKESVSV